jgi:hypothetical protein
MLEWPAHSVGRTGSASASFYDAVMSARLTHDRHPRLPDHVATRC